MWKCLWVLNSRICIYLNIYAHRIIAVCLCNSIFCSRICIYCMWIEQLWVYMCTYMQIHTDTYVCAPKYSRTRMHPPSYTQARAHARRNKCKGACEYGVVVYACTYTCICTHIVVYVCNHICIRTHTVMYVRAYILSDQTYIFSYLCWVIIKMHVCVYISTSTCICLPTYSRIYIYVYIYIYI